MKNDFLDDDWLKEELSDEYINDDDFSFSVVKKITLHEGKSKRNFYAVLVTMITLFGFLFIPDLMMIYAEGSTSLLISDHFKSAAVSLQTMSKSIQSERPT